MPKCGTALESHLQTRKTETLCVCEGWGSLYPWQISLSHTPNLPRALTLLTTPPCRRERIRAAKIKARPHWQHPKLICQRNKTTFRLQLILKTQTHPAPGSQCAQLGGRGREAPRKRGRPGFAPSEIREQGETGQATTLDFRAARVGWHTGSNYTLSVTKAGLLTGDFMAAVEYLRGSLLCSLHGRMVMGLHLGCKWHL